MGPGAQLLNAVALGLAQDLGWSYEQTIGQCTLREGLIWLASQERAPVDTTSTEPDEGDPQERAAQLMMEMGLGDGNESI